MNSDSEDNTDEDDEYKDNDSDDKTDEDNLCRFCRTDFKTDDDRSQHYMDNNTCSDLWWAQEEVLPWSKCPGCKLPYKKILLHLRKDSTCRNKVTEEEFKKFEERSKLHRRIENRKNQSKRRNRNAEAKPELNKPKWLTVAMPFLKSRERLERETRELQKD